MSVSRQFAEDIRHIDGGIVLQPVDDIDIGIVLRKQHFFIGPSRGIVGYIVPHLCTPHITIL